MSPPLAASDAPPGGEGGRPTVGSIEGRVVRLAAGELEAAAGIEVTVASRAEVALRIPCSARVAFDADRVADVRALIPGIVRSVEVEVGEVVERGQRLLVLESERVVSMQSQLRAARERVRVAEANLARQRELRADEIVSARDVELAEAELAAAEAREDAAASTLRIAGASRDKPSGRYALTAPIAGQVIRRPAVMGALATAETSLATIADMSVMWVMCDVAEHDAHRVAVGHTLLLDVGERVVRGEISWLSPEVDPRARTVTVRAEIDNSEGLLRANQFSSAHVLTGAPEASVLVPRDAIQRVEGREVVFVRARRGVYLPRVVERFGEGERVAVRGKIAPGDEVVTRGAVLLRTEVSPGSIGAGCCEVEPRGGQ